MRLCVIDTMGPLVAPAGPVAVLAHIRSRLAALRSVARELYGDQVPVPTVIVAPEGFFGLGNIRFNHEWSELKQALEALSGGYEGLLLAPGTGIRTRGGRTSSITRVCAGGSKVMNVYKVFAAGAADTPIQGTRWRGFERAGMRPAVGTIPFTRRSSRSRAFRWQRVRVGVEICNDARQGILYNDSNLGRHGLGLMIWITRGLLLQTLRHDDVIDGVDQAVFPVRTGGYLLQCGGGDNGEDCWPQCTGHRGQRRQFTQRIHDDKQDRRLGLYQKNAGGDLIEVQPSHWFQLRAHQDVIEKAVYWDAVDVPEDI